MALPEIGLKAVLDNKAFNKAMSAYIRDVDKMVMHTDLASKGMGGGFLALGGAVTKFATLTVAAGAAVAAAAAGMVVALGVDSVKTAISFESAYAGVVKTVDGLTEDFGVLNEAGRELKQEFKDLSEEVPFTFEELAEIGKIGGQLGIAKEDLASFTETIAAMGVTTDLTTEAAALGFARFMAIMGTAQSDVDRVGSSVVELGNTYATTEPELLNFALRLAGISKIAGFTEADVLGIGTAMSAVGVRAEAGGTAVQRVLIAMMAAAGASGDAFVDNSAAIATNEEKLQDLREKLAVAQQQQSEFTDKTKESTRMANQFKIDNLIADIDALSSSTAALNDMQGMLVTEDTLGVFAKTAGMSAEEFRKVWEDDAATAFTAFVQGLGEQGPGAIATLEEIGLADQRLMRSFLSLAGAGELLGSTIASSRGAWDENIAMAWEAAQRYATTEAQMKMLQNVWRNTKDDIGTMLLPALGDMMVMFRGFIDQHGPALVALFEEHIVPAVEALVEAFGKLLEGDTAGVLAGIQEALGAIVGPEVAQQIMDVADAIGEFIQQAAVFVSEHAEEIKAAFIAIGAVLAAAAIASTIVSIAGAIAALANPVGLVIAAVALLAAAWAGDWGGIKTTLTEFWEGTAQPFFQNIGDWFSNKLPAILRDVRDWFVKAWDDIKKAVGKAWDFLVGVWESLVTFFTKTIPDAAQKLWKTILEKNEAIQRTFSSVWNGILDFLKRIWDGIRLAVLTAIILVLKLIGTNLDELKAGWDFIWNAIKAYLEFVWESIQSTVETVFNAVSKFIGEALEWIKSNWETVWAAVSKVATDIWDAVYKVVSEKVEEVKAFVIETVEALQERWDELWGLIKEVAETMISGLVTALEGMAESLKSSLLDPINDAKEEVVKKVGEWIKVGKDLVDGLITGITGKVGELIGAVGGILSDAVEEAKERLKMESPSKVFYDIGANVVQGLINGILAGKGNLQSTIRGLVDIGQAFGALGSTAASMLRRRVLDPLQAQMDDIDRRIEELREIDPYMTTGAGIVAFEDIMYLMRERNRLAQEYAEAEERVLKIEKQREQLAFLQEQIKLLDFIKSRGLDARALLEGVTLGVNADLSQVIDVMSAAMQQVIDTAEDQFGIASPSKVFGQIGQNLMVGLRESIQRFASLPTFAMEAVTSQIMAPAMNMERMYAPAMLPSPVVRVDGGRQVFNQFDLTAQYRYQEERELMDDVLLLRLMARG